MTRCNHHLPRPFTTPRCHPPLPPSSAVVGVDVPCLLHQQQQLVVMSLLHIEWLLLWFVVVYQSSTRSYRPVNIIPFTVMSCPFIDPWDVMVVVVQ